jgi:hypothetical protein
MQVSRVGQSCNVQLLKNEKSIINIKASKMKKNRMQTKNDAIQNYTCNLIDLNAKKAKKKETANKRRLNSK